jgi:DNA-binding XRE family transcriptional regulator
MELNSINYIWKHRKRLLLGQKRIAYLLGHSDHKQICKWEKGEVVPSLQNALRLSYILQTPVESLFVDLYRSLGEEVEERQKSIPEEDKRSNERHQFSKTNL